MPRPKRLRCISSHPVIKEFQPVGVEEKGVISLSLEEFEAIRIIDFQGLDQSQAAEIMNVSRQTFGRILRAARYNVSNALVNAYRLKIEGGCYTMHGNDQGHGRHGHGRGNGRHGFGMGRGRNNRAIIKEDNNE
ncbi:MAG: DUF134 domain-containing protein [Pseudomonadota bacterium]